MFSLGTIPLLALATSLLSTCVAQDGFTWWVNPNSTKPISFQEGETVTLQWVTDFPKFNIVLYQNLGDSYGEFVSGYLVEKASDISSFDWIVAPIEDNTLTGNLSFHLDITIAGNDANGANSQEFLIIPNANGSSPTSTYSYPTDPYPTGATTTVYESYPYPVVITTTESGVVTTITVYEPATITASPSFTDTLVTTTTSVAPHTPTAAGGVATVSTRSYSSTASAAQQTGSQTATAPGSTASAFTGEGARIHQGWGWAAMAALGGVAAAL